MDRNPLDNIADGGPIVALRKESVDRNLIGSINRAIDIIVALRKESVDRNSYWYISPAFPCVALRKESVDRNSTELASFRACTVALRKESVDRNACCCMAKSCCIKSLSARRAWIEIPVSGSIARLPPVALRKESVDRNLCTARHGLPLRGRSPQGERG